VVVNHADGLHVRIHNRRTDEAEPSALQILAQHVGFARGRRNPTHVGPSVHLRPSVDKPPAIRVERAELALNVEKRPRAQNSPFDFHAVSNDRRIRHQSLNTRFRESRDFLRIEPAERTPIAFSLFQHDRPAESRLCGFEQKKLEVRAIVVDRHTPFAIVMVQHQRIVDVGP